MKKLLIFTSIIFTLSSCVYGFFSTDKTTTSLVFKHNWEGAKAAYDTLSYTTAYGQKTRIDSLQYVISKIILINVNSRSTFNKEYLLVDAKNDFKLDIGEIPFGDYEVSFVFGFKNEYNIINAYRDLTNKDFNIHPNFGGGYYFMKFNGHYINNSATEQSFYYHVIRAVNTTDPQNVIFQDTSFKVDLGVISLNAPSDYYGVLNTDVTFNVDISEWFKNPHTWNLNSLVTNQIINFDAQVMKSENGKNVFSLGDIIYK